MIVSLFSAIIRAYRRLYKNQIGNKGAKEIAKALLVNASLTKLS